MCFHWKSIFRQVNIVGTISKVSDKEADEYFKTRSYLSKISAWASKQSSVLKSRDELNESIVKYKKIYSDENNVPRPRHWSGWRLNPNEIEFWLNGANRAHQRLRYKNIEDGKWKKILLNP